MALEFTFINTNYDLAAARRHFAPAVFKAVVDHDSPWGVHLRDWEVIAGVRNLTDLRPAEGADLRKCVVSSVIRFHGSKYRPTTVDGWARLANIVFTNSEMGSSQVYPWTVIERMDRSDDFVVLMALMIDQDLKHAKLSGLIAGREMRVLSRPRSLLSVEVR